ncbi:MAG: hypothetical protein ABJP45_07955, partial [Cyclobacteriaceae bacterium]
GVYRMNADGANVQWIPIPFASAVHPYKAVDDPNILFDSEQNDSVGVYTFNLSDSTVRLLINRDGIDNLPSYFPNLSEVLFQSTVDGNWEVYKMNHDGSSPINLSNNPADDEYSFVSPDGKSICFHSNRTGNWEVFLMDATGLNQRRLTFSNRE